MSTVADRPDGEPQSEFRLELFSKIITQSRSNHVGIQNIGQILPNHLSKRLAFNFVRISIVYFLIGAFWMSFAGIIVPEPEPELAHQIYEVAMTHVMLVGWASFAIIGVLYYFVPKAAENEIHSERLGTVHFWITNIVVPLGVLLLAYAGFFVESLLKTGVASMEEVLGHPSFAPLYLTFIVLAIIGLAGQVIFAYNIYRTMQK